MKIKPIIIIAGEPYGVFLEIFFKSINKYKCRHPILLIASKKLVLLQMKKFKIDIKLNPLTEKEIELSMFSTVKLNIIDIKFKTNKAFGLISKNSNNYINNCFEMGLNLIKKKISNKIINGPISKKNFLHGKFLGITEYLANKSNTKKFAMLIYNENLSVSPITTHLALKNVHKHLSKKK